MKSEPLAVRFFVACNLEFSCVYLNGFRRIVSVEWCAANGLSCGFLLRYFLIACRRLSHCYTSDSPWIHPCRLY